MPSDTCVVVNADVRVMDPGGARADALALRDGRILAVGAREEILLLAGAEAATWDAGGATLLPGFIDAHHHACLDALYGGRVRLAPPLVTDIASLQAALRDAARSLPPDRWLVATNWDELLLAERRPPTLEELDDAVPDHPLMALHYSCHRALANSRALTLAGIGRSSPDPSGGVISRGKGGRPDGLLLERGMSRVESLARASLARTDAEGFFARLGAHHRALAAVGITRIVDAAVPADLAALYAEAARRGLLVVPTVMMPVSGHGYFEAPWDALGGPVTGAGEGMLVTGPLKLVFDGAPGCAMCLDWWQVAGVVVASWARALRDGSLDSPAEGARRAAVSGLPPCGTNRPCCYRPPARRGAVERVTSA